MSIWTLTVDDSSSITTTIHTSEDAAITALRQNYDITGPHEETLNAATTQGLVLYLEDHPLPHDPVVRDGVQQASATHGHRAKAYYTEDGSEALVLLDRVVTKANGYHSDRLISVNRDGTKAALSESTPVLWALGYEDRLPSPPAATSKEG